MAREDKIYTYETLQKIVGKKQSKGLIYMLGDWDARTIYPPTQTGEEIVGRNTMHNNSHIIFNFSGSIIENSNLFEESCAANELKVASTMFRKPLESTVPRRTKQDIPWKTNEPITADTHEQLDYTLARHKEIQ